MKRPHNMSRFFLFNLLALLLASCIQHKQLANFNDGPEFPAGSQPIPTAADIRIQPDDLLDIAVYAEDPAAASPFLLQTQIASTTAAATTAKGAAYLVDSQGDVELPVLGKIRLGGMALETARDTIKHRLTRYITKPIVNVRFLNFKFTVLGEVSRPATYSLPEARVTVLEAIGLAGDLTNYGNRETILIVREQDGKREFGRVNLRDRRVFASPYFYLKQNDVVYVEPLKQKAGNVSDQATNKLLPWISGAVIVLNLLFTISR